MFEGRTASDAISFAVGLTGGIGSGKSTVLQLFGQMGVPLFEADKVALGYYENPLFCREIARQFGRGVMAGEDRVDRAALASVVFSSEQALASLNAMVHPRVMSDFDRWRRKQQSPYVMMESAILFDCGIDKVMDATVLVYLDKEERISRVMERDHVSRQLVESRVSRQLPAESLIGRTDYVILNYEGNPRRRQVEYVHHRLIQQFSSF